MTHRTPLPPVILAAGLVLMPALHVLALGPQLLRLPASLLGLLPLAAGIGLKLAAGALLKGHRTTAKPFEESADLVTAGVCRPSRHPMYLGFALPALGIALLAHRRRRPDAVGG